MDADRCVCCGAIIPEGTQVCINCMAGCVECGWDDKDNCKACNLESRLKTILDNEANRIRGD